MPDLNQSVNAGQYREAIQALQQKPTYDANYFYNLGVLHGKSKQPGLATAYLEKANRLSPHDPEIVRNHKIARTELERTLPQAQIDSASNSFEQFSDRIQGDEILGVIGLVLVVVSLLWIRAYLKTRHIMKTFLKPSGWFGVLALILVLAFYGVYVAGSQNPPAVVLIKQPLRSGPGMNFPELNSLDQGVKVRMLGSALPANENELWQKIRFKADQTAWIPLSNLLPL
jgi:tetratricopeptide (TPR) repeat protein